MVPRCLSSVSTRFSGLLFLCALCLGLVAWPTRVSACTCIEAGPPCRGLAQAAAVFVGRVVAFGASTPTISTGEGMRASLQVSEVMSGAVGRSVEVFTGFSDADCGVRFAVGEEYVVYAHRLPGGELATSICSRTRRVSAAAEDLEYFRSPSTTAGAAGRLTGRVTSWENDYGLGNTPSRPVPGVQIVATDGGRTLLTTTGADGRFEIRAPVGTYSLVPVAGEGRYSNPAVATLELKDLRACADATITIRADGHVRGRVVRSDGAPVPNLALDLDSSRFPAVFGGVTDADGFFDIGHVPPGRFELVFPSSPRTLVPSGQRAGQAAFSLQAGERADKGTLTLPPDVSLVTLRGEVVDRSGRPVPGVDLLIKADAGDGVRPVGGIVTDAAGRFAISVRAGGPYRVFARLRRNGRLESGGVTGVVAADLTPLLRVTIGPP